MKSTPEDIRAYLADHPAKSASLREIIRHFAIPEADRPAFRRTVKRLAGEGLLVRARGGRYAAPEALNLVTGRLQAHPDGYAFVVPAPAKPTGEGEAAPDGVSLVREGEDIFIPPGARAGALHGDRVTARRRRGMRGKWEGEELQANRSSGPGRHLKNSNCIPCLPFFEFSNTVAKYVRHHPRHGDGGTGEGLNPAPG